MTMFTYEKLFNFKNILLLSMLFNILHQFFCSTIEEVHTQLLNLNKFLLLNPFYVKFGLSKM